MRIHHFILVWLWLSLALSPQLLAANTHIVDQLLEIHQRQTTPPFSPAELRQELARAGLDQLSPRELHEITRLFRHRLPEAEFTRQLARVLRTDFAGNLPTRTGQSFNSSNISTPDNRPLTSQEQSVMAAVLEDFQVNENVGGSSQWNPAIAMDDNGNFVVVWEDGRNGDYDIYAQRYSSSGTKSGANFRVNDDSGSSYQDDPSVAVDASGNFVVVWHDYRNDDRDIYAQRYSSSGTKSGANFRVNDDSGSSDQDNPSIAVDASGNFVVVWQDERNGEYDDIYAQRYSSSGTKSGANFRVNDDSSSSSPWPPPSIAVDASGNFVVVWEDERNGNSDIYAQKFNPNGEPIGANYRVNNDTGQKEQENPDVQLVNGRIYYCWEDSRVPGQGFDIFARVEEFLPPYPTSLSVNLGCWFPDYTTRSAYQATDYRLVGLPGAAQQSISQYLSGSPGDKWQLYWDNGASSNYLLPYDASNTFNLQAGRGYWLVHRNSWWVKTTLPSAPLNSNREVEITLHSGWNIITNPFTETQAWSGIQTTNNVTDPIYGFNGTFNQSTSFEPYQGYYFDNRQNLSVLKIPFNPAALAKIAPPPEPRWQVHLFLTADSLVDSSAFLGVIDADPAEVARYNFRKPRAVGVIPMVAFLQTDANGKKTTLATDFRAQLNAVTVWEVPVQAPENTACTLRFAGIESIPAEYSVDLLDATGRQCQNLRQHSTHSFIAQNSLTSFQIRVSAGNGAETGDTSLPPANYALNAIYPNPFNAQATIAYQLPEQTLVHLKIVDIQGREIRTLVNETKPAGIHQVQFQGLDLPSGVYFCQFQAGVFSQTRKLLLLK